MSGRYRKITSFARSMIKPDNSMPFGFRARVYWDREWNEYVVRFDEWNQAKSAWEHREAADYFTTDHEDALGTAKVMVADAYAAEEAVR